MRTRWLSLVALLAACEGGAITLGEDGTADDPALSDSASSPADSGDEAVDTALSAVDTAADTDTEEPAPPAPLGDLRQPGPYATDTLTGAYGLGGGCTLDYRRVAPDGAVPSDTAIVLAHGMQRSREQMLGWAEHLASYGFEVYVPNLCQATFLNADHPKNGQDLAAFGDVHLVGRPVLYMGYSAGALASLLAVTTDTDAVGLLTLDLVDSGDLGLDAAPGVAVPTRALFGEPSWSCNASGNGVPVLGAVPGSVSYRITDANHCDFESPTNFACTSVCGWDGLGGPAFTDAAQRDAIEAMMVAFALWASGDDPRAVAYWDPSAVAHQALASTGILTAP